MKFLIVGLGSMGKRRIRNLQYLKQKEIIGFDLREDRRKETEEKYGISTFGDINKAMRQNPGVLIISTPPNHHIEYEILAAKNGKHFFCEAGIFDDKIDKLIKMCKGKKFIAAPSSTFRFNGAVKIIKKLVDNKKIGKVVSITYHLGQYLPDWHPWEKITDFYAGQKETAATKEMIPFELGWITWIFGDIKRVSCIKGKMSSLEANIDDVYQIMMEFKDKIIGNYLVELISRTPTRIMRIIGEEGTIEWDWMSDTVKVYDARTKKWEELKEDKGFKEKGYVTKENMYIEEMQHFLNAIAGKEKYMYTLEDDKKILGLLDACEKSAKEGRHVEIK